MSDECLNINARHAVVWDGQGPALLENAAISVRDGRICAISSGDPDMLGNGIALPGFIMAVDPVRYVSQFLAPLVGRSETRVVETLSRTAELRNLALSFAALRGVASGVTALVDLAPGGDGSRRIPDQGPAPTIISPGPVAAEIRPFGCVDPFVAMRTASLRAKAALGNQEAAPAQSVFRDVTDTSAQAAGLSGRGMLVVGAPADIVLVDADALHIGPVADPLRSVVHCCTGRDVARVIIGGQVAYDRSADRAEVDRRLADLSGRLAEALMETSAGASTARRHVAL